ncbi:MAG: hypothetical protein AAGI25_04280 [Bacteroidota bacterium]
MEKISLELTINEANTLLAALGQQLYIKVADLAQKIQGQGALQLNTNRVEAPKEKKVEHPTTIKNGK